MQHPVDTSRTGASIDAAEIVRATKITTAQASPVTHYRSRSRSSFSAEDSPQPSSVASLSSSRIMPSPIPPPCAALPPTPGTSSTPGAGASPILGGKAHRNARGVKTSLRNDLRLNVGLTQEEHVELVHKILADLRPAHIGAMVRTNSCVLSPATTIASAAHQRLAANKMSLRNSVEKRHSASSQSDDCVSKGSVSTTPQLSQSRTPTPTTPGLEAAAAEVKTDKTAEGDAEKALLTPTAALESLRVLENSFQRSSVHLPREESTTQESKLSSPTTAVAPSPTRSTIDKETAASGARGKRNSSYRKSVPTPNQLDASVDALGISGASSPSPSSPSSATVTTEPSWISSLTAFEAIRVLAFQQDVAKALAPETDAAAAAGATPTETTADEVSALRYALKFAIARADRLAEALNRASDERVKVENEEFDMFPFAKPTRKNASEVSMTDFLNASRMSKIEIEQHDARRELERSLDDTASTHSRLALNGSGFVNRRGLFKSLTKMVVDQKGAGRRQKVTE
ncbi:hypothetical protein [Sporisorium scitamineum]|uniref:Uncharacterized protein n=1 Tax=Sporisorium scitamineum TaxID=49012 RepID=A0A0F7S1C8_9BASI|nr:hypothetical protein [Sporisorium scitamineum]